MKTGDDPLNQWFTALRRAHVAPDVDAGLERRLVRTMNDIPARQRRRRIILAAALAVTVVSAAGGVHAAGGLQAIRHWFSDVRVIEVRGRPDDGRPSVLMRDGAGNVVGRGLLGPPDENGDYRPRILTDDN